MKKFNSWKISKGILFVCVMFCAAGAYASSTQGLPIEDTLDILKKAFTSDIAFSACGIAVVGCGVSAMFGNFAEGTKRMLGLAFWIAVIIGALQLITALTNAKGSLI